jgi:hypothetical protein
MKNLMENWRKFLNEGMDSRIKSQLDKLMAIKAGTAGELKAGIVVTDEDTFGISIKYCFIKPDGSWFDIENDDAEQYRGRKVVQTGIPFGEVQIRKEDGNGNCLNGFEVFASGATRGFGPLLYEVALEYASQKGGGLMADRNSVSDYALNVWSEYEMREPGVKNRQLDIDLDKTKVPPELGGEIDNLTATPDDDCAQNKTIRSYGTDWDKSPLSKIYIKKSSDTMKALGDRLIVEV